MMVLHVLDERISDNSQLMLDNQVDDYDYIDMYFRCLLETSIVCRSLYHDGITRLCYVLDERISDHSQLMLDNQVDDYDYIENTCLRRKSQKHLNFPKGE